MVDALATAVGFELPDYSDSEIYTDVTGGIVDIEDAADGATESTNKLKKALLGIDELNILSEGKSKKSSGSGGGSGYPILDDEISKKTNSYMAKFNEELSKMNNTAKSLSDDIVKFFKNIAKEAKPTTDALKKLYDEGLSKLVNFTFKNLSSFYDNFLIPVGRWALGEGLPRLFNIINNLLNAIDWTKLNQSFSNFYDALAPFAINVGVGLINFIEILADILTPVVTTTMDLFAEALNLIAKGIKLIPEDVAIALGGAIGGLVTSILMFKGAESAIKIIKGLKPAFSGLLGVLTKHPILAIAAGVGALAGAMMAVSKAEFDKTNVGKTVKEVEELAKASKSFNDEIETMLANLKEQQKNIEAEYGAISILADNYFELADKQSLTNKEQSLLKRYAEELIKKIPELSKLIDNQTGAYKGTKEEIKELIRRTKEYYLVQAAQESLIEIAESQYKAEKLLSEQLKKREEIQQDLNKVQSEYNEKTRIANEATGEATLEQKEAHREAGKLWTEMKNLNNQLDTIDDLIKTTKDSQSDLNSEWDYATDYISTYSGMVNTAESDLSDLGEQAEKTGDMLNKQDMNGYGKTQISKFNSAYKDDNTTIKTIRNWGDSVNKWFTDKVNQESFSKFADNAVKGFNTGIYDKSSTSKSKLEAWGKNNNKWFTDVTSGSQFKGFGENIVSGLNSGVSGNSNSSKNIFQSWASSIKGWFTSAFDIHSPSRVAFGWAENIVQGFNNGISSMADSSKSYMDDWSDSIGGITANIGIGVNDTAVKGYIPTTSDLFYENTNDIPGLVGNIGRNNAANSGQIMQDVSGGFADAVANTLVPILMNMSGGNDGNQSITVESNLYVDSEKMYSISQKGKAKSERRFQTALQN